jgi:hypothetical protein
MKPTLDVSSQSPEELEDEAIAKSLTVPSCFIFFGLSTSTSPGAVRGDPPSLKIKQSSAKQHI